MDGDFNNFSIFRGLLPGEAAAEAIRIAVGLESYGMEPFKALVSRKLLVFYVNKVSQNRNVESVMT